MSVWRELWQALWQPRASSTESAIPVERNLIFDILAEGSRKPTVHLLTEFDTHAMRQSMVASEKAFSLTSYVAYALTRALQEQPHMQAYLKGRSKRVVFDEIDLAFMVERELEAGEFQPLHFIVRDAAQKSVLEIQQALQLARTAPVGGGGPLTMLEQAFFRLPRCLRKLVWLWVRHDPYTHKQLLGTVGITSMGMHAQGPSIVLPISPMSLTLSIGGYENRLTKVAGEWVEREFIKLNLAVDHAVIDGAPLMRFASRLVEILHNQ